MNVISPLCQRQEFQATAIKQRISAWAFSLGPSRKARRAKARRYASHHIEISRRANKPFLAGGQYSSENDAAACLGPIARGKDPINCPI